MYCQQGTLTNTKGDSLPGYFVECLSSATVQAIYSDNVSTPILGASGVANRAKTDARGNYYYFVVGGTYTEAYYDTAGVYQFTSPPIAMIDLLAAQAPFVQSVVSAATVTPTFGDDQVVISAQAAALILANPTGTATPGWGIAMRIKDNGTARAITYGAQYRAVGVTLPTTTVANKTLYLGMIYNATDTKFDVVAVLQEA